MERWFTYRENGNAPDPKEYIVASDFDDNNGESYLLRATNFIKGDSTNGWKNKATIQKYADNNWVDVCIDRAGNDTCDIGDVSLTIKEVEYSSDGLTKKVKLRISGGALEIENMERWFTYRENGNAPDPKEYIVASDFDDQTTSETHFVCSGSSCIVIQGAGINECIYDSQCSPINETGNETYTGGVLTCEDCELFWGIGCDEAKCLSGDYGRCEYDPRLFNEDCVSA